MPPKLAVGNQLVYASVALPLFYERRSFLPAWVTDNGPKPAIRTLIGILSEADKEGVRPSDYHLEKLQTLDRRLRSSAQDKRPMNRGELIDIELLCTDAFLIFGSHMLSGRINPETVDAEWFANRKEGDLVAVLEAAIVNGSVDSTLKSLLPRQQEYRNLRAALVRYRSVVANGGWAPVPEGPALKKGDTGNRIVALRRRLLLSRDIVAVPTDSEGVFDEELQTAVVRYQSRNGLESDGVVGSATLAALNVTTQERVQQLVTNLERWRWLPQELEDKYVLVNIANFELVVMEYDSPLLSMRIVVGRSYRRTPVFSDRITYLVLNPYWHVPQSLAAADILPAIKKDSTYLVDNDFEVFLGWGADALSIDPRDVDWSEISGRNLQYRFRQRPGSKNALGRVKIMFPNQFNVYLHDTPAKGLFAKAKRDFSSGCIRIAKPLELTDYLLGHDSRWNRSRIETTLQQSAEETVRIPASIPIHILYWTAWVDEDGTVHFRQDIYDRDRPLWEALSEEPPEVE
ncbi:MAG: L,D-transpeptidase family protein [bacterium]